MREFEHVNYILQKIVAEGASFNIALRSSLKKEPAKKDNNFINNITAICGGFLRHHYSLERTINDRLPIEHKYQQMVGIALSDKLFSKRFACQDILEHIYQECPEHKEEIQKFVDSINEPFELIADIPYNTDEYFHYRYNLPLFLVKMWRKNCKEVLATRLFKSFKKNDISLVRINTSKISREEFLAKYPNCMLLEEDDVASFKSIKNPKTMPAVNEGDALNIHTGYTFALRDIDFDFARGVTIYSGSSNDVLDELYAKYGSGIKVDALSANQRTYLENLNKVKRFGLKDVSLYDCPDGALRTVMSKPVHTLVLSPENSSFQRLSEESDYFLRINPDILDQLIENQKAILANAIDLVEDGGYLIYVLPTLCRNETYSLIRQFVNEHPEFVIEKEKQLFPFDRYNSMLYFAILRKEAKHD